MSSDISTRVSIEGDAVKEAEKIRKSFNSMADAMEGSTKSADKVDKSLNEIVDGMRDVENAARSVKAGVSSMLDSGMSSMSKEIASVESRLKRIAGSSASLKIKPILDESDINAAQAEIEQLKKQLVDITGKNWDIDLDLNGEGELLSARAASGSSSGTVTGAAATGGLLGGIKGAVGAGIAAAGAAATAGIKGIFEAGSERQQYMATMTHFMGGDTEGARSMMNWANQNAGETQFSSSEVMQAASRAITVSNGDVDKAKELVQLAEDMTSLTPGKSVMDAMEALADANMGEFERMNDFGFKGSKDDFDAAGGDMLAVKNQATGKTIQETFSGGTAAGAESAAAKIGIITGAFEDAVGQVGEQLVTGLGPALDSMIPIAAEAATGLKNLLLSAGQFIYTTFLNVRSALEPYMPLLSTIANLVGTVVSTAFSTIGNVINTLALPAIKLIGTVLKPVLAAFESQIESAGKVVKSLGKVISSVADAIGGFVGKISSFADGLIGKVSSFFSGEKNAQGTLSFGGGFTQMNENTRGEIVALPNGSRIYPYSTTERIIKNMVGSSVFGKGGNSYAFNVNIDARGSNLSKNDVRKLKREIINDIVEAFDNTVPA